MGIEIQKISITHLETDAIVNAANSGLREGGGVCGAIFKAAGSADLQAACDKIGHCPEGSAVITPAFRLKSKYVVHAVGPMWNGGKNGEPEKLRGAYSSALQVASDNGCKSIGFPLISAGIFGYPLDLAWKEAITACGEFLLANPGMKVVFAVLNDDILRLGNLYHFLETFIQEIHLQVKRPARHVGIEVGQIGVVVDGFETRRPSVTMRQEFGKCGLATAYVSSYCDMHNDEKLKKFRS
jgi:O-acetyl-ADP-ribose deacetylase (regulator of RNase III)